MTASPTASVARGAAQPPKSPARAGGVLRRQQPRGVVGARGHLAPADLVLGPTIDRRVESREGPAGAAAAGSVVVDGRPAFRAAFARRWVAARCGLAAAFARLWVAARCGLAAAFARLVVAAGLHVTAAWVCRRVGRVAACYAERVGAAAGRCRRWWRWPSKRRPWQRQRRCHRETRTQRGL